MGDRRLLIGLAFVAAYVVGAAVFVAAHAIVQASGQVGIILSSAGVLLVLVAALRYLRVSMRSRSRAARISLGLGLLASSEVALYARMDLGVEWAASVFGGFAVLLASIFLALMFALRADPASADGESGSLPVAQTTGSRGGNRLVP